MKLSEHFTLEELTRSDMALRMGWDNTPDGVAIENLKRLAVLLEQVRGIISKAVIVNSAYRCKKVNDAIGSKDTSQHLIGCAADIRVTRMTPNEIMQAIIHSNIEYDQLIREFATKDGRGGWVHISVPSPGKTARLQNLIIDSQGTRLY